MPPEAVSTPPAAAIPAPTSAPSPSALPSPSPSVSASPSPLPSPTTALVPAPTQALLPTAQAEMPATPPLVALALAAKPTAPKTQATAALDWALAELVSPDPSWSDELNAPWSGWCEAFVEVAYGTRQRYASAITDYDTQKRLGRIHTDDMPPAGALVFYGGGEDGHVALSAGYGQVITTWGLVGQRYQIREVGVHAFSNPYYGWSPAPDSWPGR
jgi:hypothetical protein